jgi:hypothetical protein
MMSMPSGGDGDLINQLSLKGSKSYYLKNLTVKTYALPIKASSVKPYEGQEVSRFWSRLHVTARPIVAFGLGW